MCSGGESLRGAAAPAPAPAPWLSQAVLLLAHPYMDWQSVAFMDAHRRQLVVCCSGRMRGTSAGMLVAGDVGSMRCVGGHVTITAT